MIAGAFFYFTTWRPNPKLAGANPPGWFSQPAQVEITEASGGEGLDSEEQNNISVYRRNIPSVVNVTSRAMTFDFFYGLVPQEGQGSGFVIDKEGHILTNYHVIADARQVEVTMHNRKKYKATVVGTDPAHDLAVIQIKAPDLVPSVLGDSRNLQVGQKVYAIGNPFGLAGTMTRGIVSSIRPVRETEWRDDRRGDSDRRGHQSRKLRRAADELARRSDRHQHHDSFQREPECRHRFRHPHQHCESGAQRSDDARPRAASGAGRAHDSHQRRTGRWRWLARRLRFADRASHPGGSAEQAGLHGGTERAYLGNIPIMLGGDLIVAIDGQKVQDEQDLSQMMNNHRAGDTVKVTIYRNKKKLDVNVALGEAREQV